MAAPVITTLAPASGPAGTIVPYRIVGTDLDSVIVPTSVNVSGTGVTASIDSNTATLITGKFTIAAGAAQTARTVSVTTDGGTSNTKPLTVLAAVPANPNGFQPATLANDATVGTIDWSDPTFIGTASKMAYADLAAGEQTHYLFATNAGIKVPDGYTVVGVKVTFDLNASIANAGLLIGVQLLKAGSLTGNAKNAFADGSGILPVAPAIKTAGSNSDMWGATLTPANVRNSGFGVALTLKNDHATDPARVNIFGANGIKINVYATSPGQGNTNWMGVTEVAATRRGGK